MLSKMPSKMYVYNYSNIKMQSRIVFHPLKFDEVFGFRRV